MQKKHLKLPRRRMITLIAAGMAACAVPRVPLAWGMASVGAKKHHWQGFALGAEVSLQLYHDDELAAQRIIKKAIRLMRDMEKLFSLYDHSSLLCHLNRTGVLHHPPADFRNLIKASCDISQQTEGAFDITVQPLWQYYRSKYAAEVKDSRDFDEMYHLVGYEKISLSPDRIFFNQAGMAVTLNGIAQGYVTDRVADYLKSEGMTSVLVDMGEYRALGPQGDMSPWRIGLADPRNLGDISRILDITEGAVATSAGSGDIFDASGKHHHLFDPKTGKSANRYLSVTVLSPEATIADALSTAFYAMPMTEIKKCLKKIPHTSAIVTLRDGKVVTL